MGLAIVRVKEEENILFFYFFLFLFQDGRVHFLVVFFFCSLVHSL